MVDSQVELSRDQVESTLDSVCFAIGWVDCQGGQDRFHIPLEERLRRLIGEKHGRGASAPCMRASIIGVELEGSIKPSHGFLSFPTRRRTRLMDRETAQKAIISVKVFWWLALRTVSLRCFQARHHRASNA